MARDGCNCCFSFWEISSPFTWLAVQKVKISKQWKKHLEISSFYTSVPKNLDHMLCCPWDMAHDTCNCCFSFWTMCFPFYPPNSPKKQNFKKMNLEIPSFYTRVPKIMTRWCTVPKVWWVTGGRKEKVTHRGGCPTWKLHNIEISRHDLLQKLHNIDYLT